MDHKLKHTTLDVEYMGTLAVIVATFLDGLNVYLLKIGTAFMPQLPLASVALTIAGFVLLIVSIILGKGFMILSRKEYLLKFLWIGIVGTSIPVAMVVYGVSFSVVSNSFLLQVEVIYSMILSYMLLKERITKQQAFLTTLSFFGVALVLTDGVVRTINIGDVFFLMAPLFYQLAHVVAKGVLRKVDPVVVVTYRLLISGLSLSAISIIFGWSILDFSRTFEGTVTTSCLVFAYALGQSLWYYGVKRINLSKATSIIITYPLISTILAILMLGETLSIVKIIGISLVFFSTLKISSVRSISRST